MFIFFFFYFVLFFFFFFFQAEDGIRDYKVTGVQTCALPIWNAREGRRHPSCLRSNDVCDRPYQPRLWAGPGHGATDVALLKAAAAGSEHLRSEERRVGKECRSGWGGEQ